MGGERVLSIYKNRLKTRHSKQDKQGQDRSNVMLTPQSTLSLQLPASTWREIIQLLVNENRHLKQQQTVATRSKQSFKIQSRKKQANECKICAKCFKHPKHPVKRYSGCVKSKPCEPVIHNCFHNNQLSAEPVKSTMVSSQTGDHQCDLFTRTMLAEG